MTKECATHLAFFSILFFGLEKQEHKYLSLIFYTSKGSIFILTHHTDVRVFS